MRIGSLWALAVLLGFCGGAFGATLGGVVVDGANQGIAGASVWLKEGQRIERQVSDGEGRFLFTGIGTNTVEVVSYKPGYAVGGRRGMILEDTETSILLDTAGILTIKVLGTKGEFVAGAGIKSIEVGESFSIAVEALTKHGFPLLRSNDAGDFIIDFLPAGGYASFVFQHLDYVDTEAPHLPVRAKRHNILMAPGFKVRGQVKYGDEAVSGVGISVLQPSATGTKSMGSAITDEEGMFMVRLPIGEHFVVASHDDFASPERVRVGISGLEDAVWVPLRMLRARFVEGSIRYTDGRPASGVRVGFQWGEAGYTEVVSGEEGQYSLKVGAGEGTVYVAPPTGFMTLGDASRKVSLGEDERVRLKAFELTRLPEITGVILDEEGQPAPGVLVSAMVDGVPSRTLTDAAGRFSLGLASMPESGEVGVRAEHGLRFLRRDFVHNVKKNKDVSERLVRFEPDASPWPPRPDRNDLSALVGNPAPAFECDTWINGEGFSLEESRGQVLVVIFWAGFARDAVSRNYIEELRALDALYKDVEDVRIIGIHDAVSTPTEVVSFVRNAGIEFLVGRDTNPIVSFDRYGVNFIPQVVLIDKKGVLRYYGVEGRLLELIKVLRREG